MGRDLQTLALLVMFATVTAPVSAQVVQLPTIRTFSYSGTVVVPDRGTASLGGGAAASSGFRSRGLSRGVGAGAATGGASVSATIIDQRALDRAILGGSHESLLYRSNEPSGSGRARSTREGKALVRYARRCHREGLERVAFTAYRLAISRLSGELRELAAAEFRRVFGEPAAQAIRMAAMSE